MNMNPLVTIISLLVGAELLGLLGVLLAIPAAAAIQIILRDWWSARTHSTAADNAAATADATAADNAADADIAATARTDG